MNWSSILPGGGKAKVEAGERSRRCGSQIAHDVTGPMAVEHFRRSVNQVFDQQRLSLC